MKKFTLLCLALFIGASVQAQVSAGVTITDEGVKNFYLAIGHTYNVPEQDIVVVHQRHIPDEEIPVVYFLARRAHCRPEAIIDLRLAGRSWMDIAVHYHLRPSIFYVPLNGDPGPEYGRAYGYWKQPRKQWNRIRFDDDDVVKMVNLQFVSGYYKVKPEEVVRLRGENRDFVSVARVVSSPDYKAKRAEKHDEDNGRDHGKGHGNGNGNGHGHGYGQTDDNH